MTSELLSG